MWLFWLLVICTGLLHPLLLCSYFMRLIQRKKVIQKLVERTKVQENAQANQKNNIEFNLNDVNNHRIAINISSYIIPTAISSILSMCAIIIIISNNETNNRLGLPVDLWNSIKNTNPAGIAGFAGAFVWGLYDFVDRLHSLNLQVSACHEIWFRLILGPVLGTYAQGLFAKEFASIFIFGMMAIPTSSLFKWIQDIASKHFSISTQGTIVRPQWELIQGLTPDIIEQLIEAGITSVAHLANQDPINLLRSTNIEWRNVLDMMDQAYLANYVGSVIEKLRPKGIRGAIEMAVLWSRYINGNNDEKIAVESIIKPISIDLNISEADVFNLIRNFDEDPQVNLIWSLWYGNKRV